MKILLLTYDYPPFFGGVSTYLSNLMKAAPDGVEVVVDVMPKEEHWIKTAWRQWFRMRKNKPDLIIVSHILPAGYIAWNIKFWFKAPYMVFTHGTDILSARKNGWKRFWMRFVLRRAKFVIANSRFTAGLLHEEGVKKIEIIPPGISVTPSNPEVQPDLGVRRNEIVSIGRLIPRKGFDTLIKAMPAILKDIPEARLTIIGRGHYYEELDRLAHELRVETFIDIKTDVSNDLKFDYLKNSTVFALAARRVGPDVEGFGIVVIEASSFGLPVVVGRSGGATETVVDGVTGIVVEPDSAKLLAEAIVHLLKNPDEARRMGAAGREYVTREYSIDFTAKKFWDILSLCH